MSSPCHPRHPNNTSPQGVSTREMPVGLVKDMTLARRVQLAVLAHIRHVHTRYDQLLKETTWQNARKVVEQLCLDTLVQWRGDEETGRDQLDEILREVVVISDSDTGESDDESDSVDGDSPGGAPLTPNVPGPSAMQPQPRPELDTAMDLQPQGPLSVHSSLATPEPLQQPRTQRRNQRGFKRYRAWEEALRRNRDRDMEDYPAPMETDAGPYSVYPPQQPVYSVAPAQPVYRQPFAGAAAPRPVTPPSQDIPIQSIEPTSPQTMAPSFIRRVSPRANMEGQRSDAWDQHAYPANAPMRNSPYMVTPNMQHPVGQYPVGQYPVGHAPAPVQPYQQPYGQEMTSSHGPRQVFNYLPPGTYTPLQTSPPRAPPAQRIIMDANRPGERSNPIIMEDRGGFFERVSQPEEYRTTVLEPPILIREVRRWSRPPEGLPRQYAVHRDSPLQDHDMEGIEVYHPVARELPASQWRPPPHPPGPSQPVPMAVRDHGAIHIRSVSQPESPFEHGGFPSPRRDV